MQIEKLNFPELIAENEKTYLNYIEGLIGSLDKDASILFSRLNHGIRIRISPSTYEAFDVILSNIKKFHTMINIELEFSKSMKAGSNISYVIDF